MPKVFTNYADSPLALLLDQALETVSQIKKKYAVDLKQADTTEKQTAQNTLHMVETALGILHQVILPKFSGGQAPGMYAIGKILAKARKLRPLVEALETREMRVVKDITGALPEIMRVAQTRKEYDTYNPIASIIDIIEEHKDELFEQASKISGPEKDVIFADIKTKICSLNLGKNSHPIHDSELIYLLSKHLQLEVLMPKHPMIYELMEMGAQLIKTAPSEIEKIIPFFNPKSSIEIFQSGMLGTLLSTFGSFHIKQLESKEPEVTSYAFEASVNGQNLSFDAAQLFPQERDNFLYHLLEPALRRYLAVYGETHSQEYPFASKTISEGRVRVESEFARFSILQRLTNISVETIRQTVLSSKEVVASPCEEIQDLPILQSIAGKIEYNNRLLLATRQLKATLSDQQAIYASTSVIDLLRTLHDPTLLNECIACEHKGLDVSYLTQPLPETIVEGSAGETALGKRVVGLKHLINWFITQQTQELQMREESIQEQATTLHALLIAQYQYECSVHTQNIASFELNLIGLNAPVAKEVNSIENELQSLSMKLDEHVILRQKVMALIQKVQLPLSFTSVESLRPLLEETCSEVNNAAEKFIHNLTSSQQALEKKQTILRIQLEKRQSEQRFAENLRSADPAKMQLLLSEKNRQLSELQEEHRALSEAHALAQTNRTVLRAKQENLALQQRQKREELSTLQTESDTVQAVITSLSQSINIEASRDIQHYQNLLERLCSIKSILVLEKNKTKIPFKQIDAVMAFDQLLLLLGDHVNTQDWKVYRKCQESVFKRSPSRGVFIKMQTLLLKALDKKIIELDRCSQIIPEIRRHTELQQNNDAIKITIEGELNSIESQFQATTLALEQCEDELANITHIIHCLTTEKEPSLKKTQYVLSQSLMILTKIDQFTPQIEVFAENTNFDDLPGQILDIQNISGLLITNAETVERVLETLENSAEYQPMLTIIRQLLQQIHQRVILASEEKTARWEATIVPPVIPTILTSEEEADEITDIVENQTANDAIVAARQDMAQALVLSINDYRKKRAAEYKVNDFFTSADKTARELFITQLEMQLLDYANTGNSDVVLETIQQKFAKFPGKNLQPLLHKITAAVLSFGQEITTDSERLVEILTSLENNHPQYAITLKSLLQKISDMRDYGAKRHNPIIIELADKLKQDVQRFVLNHGEKLPDIEMYQTFTKKFNARLHSEDNVMHEEGKNWTHLVANIALVLFLIPKLIYSKVATGRCSFFFEETKATDFVSSIEGDESTLALQLPPRRMNG